MYYICVDKVFGSEPTLSSTDVCMTALGIDIVTAYFSNLAYRMG